MKRMLLEVVFIVYLSFCILNKLLLLCVCLSIFFNMIAIDAEYSFKFHPTRGCFCFNSHNDVPHVAQRNVTIVAHTRHRSPYLPQPDCCCCVPFLIKASHTQLSGTYTWPQNGRCVSVHRPTRYVVIVFQF